MSDPEIHEVQGYVLCIDCQDELVIDVVARRTGNLCVRCLHARGEPLRRLEIEARGARLSIPTSSRPRKRPSRKRTVEAKAHQRQVDKCKERARKRLAALFPDLYDIYLAEERAAAGLDPWPLNTAVEAGPDPDGSQTAAFAVLYHALDERGVEV